MKSRSRDGLAAKALSPVILDLCLGKTGAEKLHYYRDVIIFEKLSL